MSSTPTLDNLSEWLHETFFRKVLKSHLKLESDDYSIVSIDTKLATKEGDNYMAVLLRSTVEFETIEGIRRTQNYIIKALLTNGFSLVNLANEFEAFPKEQKMYSKFLPAFEKLYADVGVDVSFGPKFYYTTNEPTPMIVMEDLSDYEMTARAKGFDQAQAEHGLVWLAKFHAASMVYKEGNGPYGDEYTSGIYTMKVEPTLQSYFDLYMPHFYTALRKLPDGEKYIAKVEKWQKVLFSMMCKTLEYDESSFNVLNHGDTWGNNFMFRYDEERNFKSLKLVDYQVCYWGSVAQDIYYFMMSSWNNDIKVKKFDQLIKFYFDHLIDNLTLLGYSKKLPQFEDLEKELTRKQFLAAAFTVELLPFPLCEKLFTDPDFLNYFYSTPTIEAALAEVIPWLYDRGAMDFEG